MLLKLLDRSDIIRYGKTVIDLPNHIAENLIKIKRAIIFVGNNDIDRNKNVQMPPQDKMMWVAPEKKSLGKIKEEEEFFYPGDQDPLFPVDIIGRK